ncbi:MAG TPA: hypothetical protein QGF58_17230 [Myxococcota bacterium]|nr:hypothetical protein [Myxococcota bacterium]
MADTRWGSFEVWLEPAGFGRRQPVNGPHRSIYSTDRHTQVPVPTEVFVQVLSELERSYGQLMWGQQMESRINIQGVTVGFVAKKARPACEVCSDPLPVMSTDTDGTIYCSSCGAPSLLRPSPYWLRVELPTAVQVYGGVRDGQAPPPSATDPAFGSVSLSAKTWYVRFEGDFVEELDLDAEDESTEEEFLSRLGVTEDPRELMKALEFAESDFAKRHIQAQLDELTDRVERWSVGAAQRARAWILIAWALAGLYAPAVPLMLAAVWMTPFEFQGLIIEESPFMEIMLIFQILLLFPAIFAAQKAVQARGGVSFSEAFSHVGFHLVIALLPGFGLLAALVHAKILFGGTLVKADITDSDGNLLRPYPLESDVHVGSASWPAATLILLATITAQGTWLSLLGPYLF